MCRVDPLPSPLLPHHHHHHHHHSRYHDDCDLYDVLDLNIPVRDMTHEDSIPWQINTDTSVHIRPARQ